MEHLHVSPNNSNRILPKSKDRAGFFGPKMDTEKLRVLLREKCRIRVKQSRKKCHDISRTFLQEEKEWLTQLVKEFDENIELEDLILHELIDESYQWMIEQYENELEYLASTENKSQVLCPICQLSELSVNNAVLNCQCGFRLNYAGTIEDFWNRMQQVISKHEENCASILSFYVEPNEFQQMRLSSMCNRCDYYAEIA